YLRNVKQILRQAEGGFDERRFGFGGLMDLLRALQREGLVRVERDRRGGLRGYQGAAVQRPPGAPQGGGGGPRERQNGARLNPRGDAARIDVQPEQIIEVREALEAEPVETEPEEVGPIPIDTTAELLGRAKPKRPSARSGQARARKTAAARKTTTRRGRTKK